MIIRDTPADFSKYYMADEDVAFALHQAGVKPDYIDNGAVYFKKTNKLFKVLKRLGINPEPWMGYKIWVNFKPLKTLLKQDVC